MRCEHCRGSGLADKQGPNDDALLERAVLSAIVIDRMRSALEQIADGYLGDQTAEQQFVWAQSVARAALCPVEQKVQKSTGS